MFDPFETKQTEEDDELDDLGERFISSHLFDDDEPVTSMQQPVWNKDWTPSCPPHDLKQIWSEQHNSWQSFEPYARGNEHEFDPTLQFYRGSLYDAHTIQDINRLSLEVPSVEEKQADNVDEDMSALQMMQTIFSDLKDEELIETLEQYDYDADRAIEALLNKKLATQPTLPQQTKRRPVCRHFLAGECYRKDCWFAHDLQEKVCKFWLQGGCLKGDSCEFSHRIDIQEVANKISIPDNKPKPKPSIYDPGNYPALSSTVKSVKTQPITQPSKEEEEFPTLAAAASTKPSKQKTTQPTAINFAEAAKKKKKQAVQSNPKSKQSMQYHAKPYKYSMQELTRPVHLPWLETGSSLNSIYMKEREKAIEYGMLRNRFFSKATEYYLKGDGARAKLYSMEAKHYNRLMQEMHTEASQRIFNQRSKHEAFIDLHGLHEDEALDIVEDRLQHLKTSYSGVIYIVTGTGHHSGASGLSKKQSKLKPSIQQYLKQEHYRFAETSMVGDNQGGIFAVEI
ncbi:hypothetical protein EDC96DRAFT_529519 [Choanephora cucurbitarum]|nr:hypothetical protein EDC96DRAFT_529519 [Choanephora cucurbitarum]